MSERDRETSINEEALALCCATKNRPKTSFIYVTINIINDFKVRPRIVKQHEFQATTLKNETDRSDIRIHSLHYRQGAASQVKK
jgi:hypothetical protein